MNKLTAKFVAIILAFVIIVALFFIFINNSNQPGTVTDEQLASTNSKPNPTKDSQIEVVETYITFMHDEQFSKMKELWPNANAGKTEYNPDANVLDFNSIYKFHHDTIVSLFGKNAWQNVSYEFTKIPAPEGKAKWVEKSTGNEITFEESVKLNEEYWKKVLEENNRTDAKYIDEEPTAYIVEELYERYSVDFSFGGQSSAKSGENSFNITIVNKDGHWVVYDMLTWNPPITEPTSEV